MSTRTRKDWILWGALGCALVSTAHAEYTLATAAHFNEYVALAVPGALDLYVVRALQQRRDVFVAVLAMVAANVASHLIAGGVLEVRWPVIAAVGAVAPLIVWRVYALKYESGAVSAPAPVDECAGEKPQVNPHSEASAPALAWAPGYHLDGCDGLHKGDGPALCLGRAGALTGAPSAPAPDSVPQWMRDEYAASAPAPDTSAPVLLRAVPDLPAEYAASAVHSESPLTERDLPFLAGAQKYVDDVADPSVRGLKAALGIGQDRAQRLLLHLGVIL